MTKTLQQSLAEHSPESQARIQEMADNLLLESQLYLILEKLNVLQK